MTGVSKAYGRVQALNKLDLEVPAGCFFVLFGPSSVGKTTTLRTIAGLVRPDEGRIEIFGKEWTHQPIAGRNVSMVFQSFALYPHLTVFDNLAYPLREEGVESDEIKKRVTEVATMLKLAHKVDRKPNTLSGGEQQRVALGRSLVRRPKVLLLDEPLTNLDAKLRHDMRAELKRLHRQLGMTIVYATPDELEALSMGEQIAVLRDGAVVQRGTPDELYEQPINTYVAGKIGSPHMNILDASISKDGASIKSSVGKFKLPRAMKSAAGQKALLGVRPSDITVSKTAKGTDTQIHMLEPLGDVTVVSVVTGNDTLRVVMPESSAMSLKPGDKASLSIAADKFHIFHAASGEIISPT